jgi:tetratricopeptide (TPR) repeat protein
MKLKQVVRCALFGAFFLFPMGSHLMAQPHGSDFKQAERLLKEGSLSFDEGQLSAARDIFEPCANTLTGRFDCCYEAAQARLFLARCEDLKGQRDKAKKTVDEGIQAAQKTVLMKNQSADAHALLARLYEAKLSYGDMFTGMAVGPKAGEENKKALALDPENAQVQLAAGIQYVMAPPIGGGDVKKGIATLQKALELDPKMDETYYWLAKAYRKLNDRENFKKALAEALRLNPKNAMAQKESGDWK